MKRFASLAYALSAGLVISLFIVAAVANAQETGDAGRPAVNPAGDAGTQRSALDYFEAGGLLMYPIALCSLAVIGLVIYHSLELRAIRMIPPTDLEALRHMMYVRDAGNAFSYCENQTSSLAAVLRTGVLRLNDNSPDKGRAAAEAAMTDSLQGQETRMGFWLNMISVIAAISPMLGLFGTVTGMISAFEKIGLGGMGKPEKLAGDIGVALITTAGGLLVGIPAMLAFYIFRGRLDALLARVGDTCTELIDLYTGEGIARQSYELRANAPQGYTPPPGCVPHDATHSIPATLHLRQGNVPQGR